VFDLKNGRFILSQRNKKINSTITLFAVGDIVLDLGVKSIIKQYGPLFPFRKISKILNEGDIVFGNLESPLSSKKIKSNIKKRIHFCGNPNSIKGVKYAGFNIVNLANNHIMDFGEEVLRDAINLVRKNGIGYVGAGYNLEEARRPFVINVKGISAGFLGYASLDLETNATENKPGTAPSKIEFMIDDVRRLKNNVDIVIVSIHRGLEFVYYPMSEHQQECRRLIEEGADIILCHHPHVPQGIEIYKSGIIAYSLGEFISDFEPPFTKFENALFLKTKKECFFIKVRFDSHGLIDGEVIPRHLNKDFQAYVPSMEEKQSSLRLIHKLSEQLKGNRLESTFWKNSKNYLILQSSAMLLNQNNRNLKGLISFLRWINSDRVFKMIIGNIFRINPPEFLVSLKRLLVSTFLIIPYRFFIKPFKRL